MADTSNTASEFTVGRGDPWEFDLGPPRNRKWPRLFSETPNYRGLGVAASGEEEFRWHQGPMFYRGRLRDNEVRILMIGQEGASDESLSHRSFTGSAGATMQHFLNHIGITHSYLFLNTFLYPIFGQYNGVLPKLAQHPESPIAKHRHEIFDYVVERNSLALVVGIGKAAKESVAAWIESHGGTADPDQLDQADATVIAPGLRAVGLTHPSAARTAEAKIKVTENYREAIDIIAAAATSDPAWMPVDPDGTRLPSAGFELTTDPVPFRDFAFGAPWRLGRGGTSSNRMDDQESIQIFSSDGKKKKSAGLTFPEAVGNDRNAYIEQDGDRPWEPPRADHRSFDRGPSASMARLLMGGNSRFPYPDFWALGLSGHPSFGCGPAYRGDLSRPSVLVLADQQSHDDVLTARALTGEPGQHLQAWLRSAGLAPGSSTAGSSGSSTAGSYCILRVFPVDSLSASPAAVATALADPGVLAFYREVVRRIRPQVVVTLGPNAKDLAATIAPNGTPKVAISNHGSSGWKQNWQNGLDAMKTLTYDTDASPSFAYDEECEQIPRVDLPYGTLRWQGSSGTRVQQPIEDGQPSPHYFRVRMPEWVSTLEPPPLSTGETKALNKVLGD